MQLDQLKRNRVNQMAVTGSIAMPSGYQVLSDVNDLLVWALPGAPESFHRLVVFLVAVVGGAVLGKIVRTLEN